MKNYVTLTLLLIAICKTSFATILIVNNNFNPPVAGQYYLLQDAINAANSGDTIYVVGSPNTYGSVSIGSTPKSFVFIGAGYRPAKDFNYSSKIDAIGAATIFGANGNNSKIFGFEITGGIGKDGNSCCGANGMEIAYNKFVGSGTVVAPGDNCNIHDNYFEVANNGGGYGVIQLFGDNPSQIHNNIFSRLIGTNGALIANGPPHAPPSNLIYNNHFLSVSGGFVFNNIGSSTMANNIFYGYAVADTTIGHPTNCTFDNNLVYNSGNNFILFDNNTSSTGINYVDTMPVFVYPTANYAFDFPPFDFSLDTSSVGHNGGTDTTDIGAFGGTNSFSNFTGMQNIPIVVKLDLFNSIVGQGDSLKFHTTGYANQGDSIIAISYFIDTDSNGTSIPIPFAHDTEFDFYYSIDHDSLALGNHVFGLRVMNSNGIWSHPEMRSFMVCLTAATISNFSYQVSGHNVLFTNNSIYNVANHWDFGDGDTSNTTSPFHHYQTAGLFNACLIGYNPCSSDTICKGVSITGLQSVFPNQVAGAGTFIFDIKGAGLSNVIELKFENATDTIIPDSIITVDDYTIHAIFHFVAAPLGTYNVRAKFSTLINSSLINAVQIQPYQPAKLSVNITGDPVLRIGLNEIYHITVSNSGNVDAYFPIILIGGLPLGTTFEFVADSLIKAKDIYGLDTLGINWDSLATYSIDDSSTMTSLYMIQSYKIPASGNISFGVIFHVPASTTLHTIYEIKVIVTTPLYSSVNTEAVQKLTYSASDCWISLADFSLHIVAGLASNQIQCALGIINFGRQIYGIMKDAGDESWNNNHQVLGPLRLLYDNARITQGIVKTGANCAGAALDFTGFGKIASTIWKIYDKGGTYITDFYKIYNNCINGSPLENAAIGLFNALIGNATDPNQKYGPGGNSTNHYINDNGEFLYTINFENDSTANLAAQTIKVIDTLDVNKFDLSTFSFTNENLGYKSISQNNSQSFFGDIDFSNELGVNARISGQLDATAGIVTWIINTIDTATNQVLINNAALGILPPDTASPKGQGSVSFRIKLLQNVTNTDTVRNSATIVFDNNAPIITPIWQNVIDTIKPQSSLSVSNSVTTGDSVLVSWSGTDVLSGVESYTVYFSTDSINYYQWLPSTNATSAYFYRDSTIDTVYFYSVARDSAGNIEDAPTMYDASTVFTTVGMQEITQAQMLVKLFPNPANNSVNIYIKRIDNRKNDFNIIAKDITGRTIRNEKLNLTSDSTTLQFDISQFVSGVYFFEVTDGTYRTFKKLIKN